MKEDRQGFLKVFAEFARGRGLPEALFGAGNECRLMFGTDVVLTIHYNQEAGEVTTFAVVGGIADIPDRCEFLLRIMRANYFWMTTNGFTLALDRESDQLVAMDKEEAAYFIDVDVLEGYLDTCVELVYDWRRMMEAAKEPKIELVPPQLSQEERDDSQNSNTDDLADPHNWMMV